MPEDPTVPGHHTTNASRHHNVIPTMKRIVMVIFLMFDVWLCVCVRVCVRAYVCVCACGCVRACGCVCVCVCVCVWCLQGWGLQVWITCFDDHIIVGNDVSGAGAKGLIYDAQPASEL